MLKKSAFTLIEVMVSVMIISVVVASLLQMNANNTNIFKNLKSQKENDQYLTLLIDNKKYGFENDEHIPLYRLVENFNLDDDFRRELKDKEIDIKYQKLDSIDFNEFSLSDSNLTQEFDYENEDDQTDKEVNSFFIFEIGKTIIKQKDSSVALLRIRVQK